MNRLKRINTKKRTSTTTVKRKRSHPSLKSSMKIALSFNVWHLREIKTSLTTHFYEIEASKSRKVSKLCELLIRSRRVDEENTYQEVGYCNRDMKVVKLIYTDIEKE